MKNINSFRIALIQAEKLLTLKSDKHKVVAVAVQIADTRKILKNKIKNFLLRVTQKQKPKPENLQVLVHARGGIGDIAMLRIFIKKFKELLPANADIFVCYDVKQIIDLIFPSNDNLIKGYVNKKYLPDDYDIVLSGAHVLIYKHYDMARIERLAPSFLPVLKKGLEMSAMLKIIDDNTPHLDGYLANIVVQQGESRVSILGTSAGFLLEQNERAPLPLQGDGAEVLRKFGLEGVKYITVHNGINISTGIKGEFFTRMWTIDKWREFVTLFKNINPHIKIVQLGGKNTEIFDFADASLVGKTIVSDLTHIIKNSLLHIDGDSGIVHLANLTETRCVVVFGPTPVDYFAYKNNINIFSDQCSNCMNLEKYWASKCILGYDKTSYCLAGIRPEDVIGKIGTIY